MLHILGIDVCFITTLPPHPLLLTVYLHLAASVTGFKSRMCTGVSTVMSVMCLTCYLLTVIFGWKLSEGERANTEDKDRGLYLIIHYLTCQLKQFEGMLCYVFIEVCIVKLTVIHTEVFQVHRMFCPSLFSLTFIPVSVC